MGVQQNKMLIESIAVFRKWKLDCEYRINEDCKYLNEKIKKSNDLKPEEIRIHYEDVVNYLTDSSVSIVSSFLKNIDEFISQSSVNKICIIEEIEEPTMLTMNCLALLIDFLKNLHQNLRDNLIISSVERSIDRFNLLLSNIFTMILTVEGGESIIMKYSLDIMIIVRILFESTNITENFWKSPAWLTNKYMKFLLKSLINFDVGHTVVLPLPSIGYALHLMMMTMNESNIAHSKSRDDLEFSICNLIRYYRSNFGYFIVSRIIIRYHLNDILDLLDVRSPNFDGQNPLLQILIIFLHQSLLNEDNISIEIIIEALPRISDCCYYLYKKEYMSEKNGYAIDDLYKFLYFYDNSQPEEDCTDSSQWIVNGLELLQKQFVQINLNLRELSDESRKSILMSKAPEIKMILDQLKFTLLCCQCRIVPLIKIPVSETKRFINILLPYISILKDLISTFRTASSTYYDPLIDVSYIYKDASIRNHSFTIMSYDCLSLLLGILKVILNTETCSIPFMNTLLVGTHTSFELFVKQIALIYQMSSTDQSKSLVECTTTTTSIVQTEEINYNVSCSIVIRLCGIILSDSFHVLRNVTPELCHNLSVDLSISYCMPHLYQLIKYDSNFKYYVTSLLLTIIKENILRLTSYHPSPLIVPLLPSLVIDMKNLSLFWETEILSNAPPTDRDNRNSDSESAVTLTDPLLVLPPPTIYDKGSCLSGIILSLIASNDKKLMRDAAELTTMVMITGTHGMQAISTAILLVIKAHAVTVYHNDLGTDSIRNKSSINLELAEEEINEENPKKKQKLQVDDNNEIPIIEIKGYFIRFLLYLESCFQIPSNLLGFLSNGALSVVFIAVRYRCCRITTLLGLQCLSTILTTTRAIILDVDPLSAEDATMNQLKQNLKKVYTEITIIVASLTLDLLARHYYHPEVVTQILLLLKTCPHDLVCHIFKNLNHPTDCRAQFTILSDYYLRGVIDCVTYFRNKPSSKKAERNRAKYFILYFCEALCGLGTIMYICDIMLQASVIFEQIPLIQVLIKSDINDWENYFEQFYSTYKSLDDDDALADIVEGGRHSVYLLVYSYLGFLKDACEQQQQQQQQQVRKGLSNEISYSHYLDFDLSEIDLDRILPALCCRCWFDEFSIAILLKYSEECPNDTTTSLFKSSKIMDEILRYRISSSIFSFNDTSLTTSKHP